MIKYFMKSKKFIAVSVVLLMLVLLSIPVLAVETENEHIHDQCADKNPDDFLYSYETTSNYFVYSDVLLDEAGIEQIRQAITEILPNYEDINNQSLASSCSPYSSHSASTLICVDAHRIQFSECCCYHILCYRFAICKNCGDTYIYGEVFENGYSHVFKNNVCTQCGLKVQSVR